MMTWLSYIVFAIALLCVLSWRFKSHRTEYGSARWLELWTAAKQGLFRRRGIPLGDWGWAYLRVSFDKEGHILTVAPPGGGKSSTGSIPSGLSRNIQSRFVTDPDGEVSAICIKAWREDTDAFFVINPARLFAQAPWSLPSHAFDPMAFIDPASMMFGKRAKYLASALVTRAGHEDGSTAYFKSEGIDKLAAYIAFGALHGVTLPVIRDWIALPVGDSDEEVRVVAGTDFKTQFELWEAMEATTALDGMIAKQAIDLRDKYLNAPAEFQAVFSTVRNAMGFLDEPTLRAALSKNEVAWGALKDRRAVISVVMPRQDWQVYGSFVRLAFLSTIWALEEGDVARHRVHVLMEEFATLGRLEFFADILATARKKKAQIEVVIQNLGQIKAQYPEWQALLPMFEVRRFKAVRDVETAKHVSEAMGNTTLVAKDPNDRGRLFLAGRQLRTPDEIMTMAEDRQIVFIGNLKPALLGQYPYWEKKGERARALASPFYPDGMPARSRGAALRAATAQALKLLGYALVPHPLAVVAVVWAGLWWADPAVTLTDHYTERRRALVCRHLTITGMGESRIRFPRWKDRCPSVRIMGLWI